MTLDRSLDHDEILRLIRTAIDEDLRYGSDVTTMATVAEDAVAKASVIARAPGIIAGLDVGLLVLDEIIGTDKYKVVNRIDDGARIEIGDAVLTIEAPTRGLLTAERTMLNIITHLSGIATATSAWVDAVEGTNCQIRDSRKTLPGLRAVQKYAVRVGGGSNHRMGLGDAALIKDNHVVAAGSVVAALHAVRKLQPDIMCEVEVDTLEQLNEILDENVELVLLDNFSVAQTQEAVKLRNARAPQTKLESSGGLTLDVAADYAQTGIDYMAVGGLTHSVRALDLALDM